MDDIQSIMTNSAYALFALEQQLTLPEIAEGARAGVFPAATLHTPDWFAAAADSGDLLAMAPELRQGPDDETGALDLAGVDLIQVYAPESAVEAPEEEAADVDQVEEPKEQGPVRIGLLKELGDLD